MDLGRILNDSSSVELAPRAGKWTDEEERYAAALVTHFVAGSLAIPSGTSLRSFLAKRLRCSAMRVSTKLATDTLGELKIPKRLGQKRFFPTEGVAETHRQRVTQELSVLRMAFLQKVKLPDQDESDEDMAADSASGEEDSDGPVRVGSWSGDEEAYAEALIDAFLQGVVRLAEGATLRAYLADRLSCNPMRISKKLAIGKIGKMVVPKRLGSATYRRNITAHNSVIYRVEYELEQLRFKCFSTATNGLQNSPSRTEPRDDTSPAWQNEPSREQFRTPAYTVQSPLQTGTKRKLPSLDQAPGLPYLPSLQSALHMKKNRQPSAATVSF